MADEVTRLLADQVAYYRARSAEYDLTSTPDGDPHAALVVAGRNALRDAARGARVIEIAAGTGQWTGVLAEVAADLLVTDASPEMLALNRLKTGERANVHYRTADAFSLEATHDRDAVVTGFFLSHVPLARFEAFWSVVEGLLGPAGRACFIDEGVPGVREEEWLDRTAGIVHRRLNDGASHRAVKILWEPRELEARLRGLGWNVSIQAAPPFYWGTATR